MRFDVLGPLSVQIDTPDGLRPVTVRGRRQRAVLARLLIARGRAVATDHLIEDLWDDPPASATSAIQTFVGDLRRALEPDRPRRSPSRLLVTTPAGYLLQPPSGSLDVERFEAALATPDDPAHELVDALDEALGLWRGAAYAEFAQEDWARAESLRLEELRSLAVERRAQALLAQGRSAQVVAQATARTLSHPERPSGWWLLVRALQLEGRAQEALEALRRAPVQDRRLRQIETDLLRPTGPVPGQHLVERDTELAVLRRAAHRVLQTRRLGLILLCGPEGIGKSALTGAFRGELDDRGWLSAIEGMAQGTDRSAGAPWSQILPPPGRSIPSGDPATARFRRNRAMVERVRTAAARTPLALVVEDLHRVDEPTAGLLSALLGQPDLGPVLLLLTYRTGEVPAELTALLGQAARSEPTRVYLDGLGPVGVADLVGTVLGAVPDPDTAGQIHRRTAGNPFFVKEVAQLLAAGGRLEQVPPGVRDVVRHRVDQLPQDARHTLRRAAVLGDDIDLELLGPDRLDDLELAVRRGFLRESGIGRFRWVHALVRDTVYADLSRSRRAAEHAGFARLLEQRRPGDLDALARHFVAAGPMVERSTVHRYARAAAHQAEGRFATRSALRWWSAALEYAGEQDRIEALTGAARALAFAGDLFQARQLRRQAVDLAEARADPVLTARVITAFDVPAIWTEPDDLEQAAHLAAAGERTLPALSDPGLRSRVLATIALELRSRGGARARRAAKEAEELARAVGDPAVLTFALNARFMQTFHRAGLASERAAIGRELLAVSSAHDLVTFEVLAHLILLQSSCALADFEAADESARAVDQLGRQYQIPLAGVFTAWYRALRDAVAADPATASRCRAAAVGLPASGMTGLDGILPLALLCTALVQENPLSDDEFGGYEPWCRPFFDDTVPIPPSPRDLLFELRTCLDAIHAVRRRDLVALRRIYADLEPAAHELPAGSGLVTLEPVAHYLAEIAAVLGRPEEVRYRRLAEQIGRRLGR